MLSRSPLLVLSTFSLLLIAVSGCTPTTDAGTLETPKPTGPVEQSPQPNPVPSLSPTGTPIALSCSDLVSPDTIYDFNPNFSAIRSYKPADGTVGASAIDLSGVACRWQNETSSETIDLSVADVDTATIASLTKAAAAQGSPAEVDGADAAYFSLSNGVGAEVAFVHGYWIVVSSPFFSSSGDAATIVGSVISKVAA